MLSSNSSMNDNERDLIVKFAQKQKVLGNEAMSARKYAEAVNRYSKAIRIAPDLDFSFYSNRALAYVKLGYSHEQALNDAKTAEEMLLGSEGHIKAAQQSTVEKLLKCYTLEAKCLFELARFREAIELCDRVISQLGYDPNHKSIGTFTFLKNVSEERERELAVATLGGTHKINFVELFRTCDELTENIFSYLSPNDMLQCDAVCSEWRHIANDNHFWRRFCELRWLGKQNISFEKVVQVHGSDPNFNWKQKYYQAEHNASRVKLTAQELQKINFSFIMGHQINQKMKAKFFADHTFTSSLGMVMNWKFVDLDYKIQVEEYPPLKISRDKNDWGWVLTNDYVFMKSESFDP